MATKPSLLRVKRKRAEEPADVIILDVHGLVPDAIAVPSRKRHAAGDESTDALEAGMRSLTALVDNGGDSLNSATSAEPAVATETITTQNLAGHTALVSDATHAAPSNVRSLRFRRVDTVPQQIKAAKARARFLLQKLVTPNGSAHTTTGTAALAAAGAARDSARAHMRRDEAVAKKRSSGGDPYRELFHVYDVVGGGVHKHASGQIPTAAPGTTDDGTSSSAFSGHEYTAAGRARLVHRGKQLRDPRAVDARVNFVPVGRVISNRVLNPFQRQMDQGIWKAFQSGDFSAVFASLNDGMDVNYQRPQSDLSTALMAAAFAGDDDVATDLLTRGALVRIPNVFGHTALRIATERGHAQLAALLADALLEEEEELTVAAAFSSRPPAHPPISQPPQPRHGGEGEGAAPAVDQQDRSSGAADGHDATTAAAPPLDGDSSAAAAVGGLGGDPDSQFDYDVYLFDGAEEGIPSSESSSVPVGGATAGTSSSSGGAQSPTSGSGAAASASASAAASDAALAATAKRLVVDARAGFVDVHSAFLTEGAEGGWRLLPPQSWPDESELVFDSDSEDQS